MNRGHRGSPAFAAIVAIVVAACGSSSAPPTQARPSIAAAATSAPSATPSATTALLATATPDAISDPIEEATPSPTPDPTPTPPPTPKPTAKPAPATPTSAAGWTTPRALIDSTDCQDVTAAIDQAGRYHLAATCGDSIRTYASTGASSWSTRLFVHPADRAELAPQIAIAGNVEYVAYYRIAPDGGCGSLGTDIGVYFRSRTLPNGAWSVATKVGAVADTLQSFDVAGSTIHLTVANDGKLYYETRTGPSVHRYLIPDAGGRSSLAVGSDGRARIAYETSTGLRLGVYTGSSLSSSKVGGSTGRDWAPRIALDSADKPHLVWTRSPAPGGCAGPGPDPDDGTYYATNAGGSWVKHRITTATGTTTFDMNATSGRVYTVVSTGSGMRCYIGAPNGTWTGFQVVSTKGWASSPVVRVNDVSGAILVAYVDSPMSGRSRIYTLSKP